MPDDGRSDRPLLSLRIARGLALRFNEGRPIAVPESQEVFLALGNARVLGIVPVPVLVMVAAFVVTAVLLHRTRFGQHLYAIGGNREAAVTREFRSPAT